jgi:1-deoxy-D-xylulose-5-phosphate reductoisomerase
VTRKISILGATGSIGTSTLDLIKRSPERFQVEALTAASNVEALADAARRTEARLAVIADPGRLAELEQRLAGPGCRALAGPEALVEAAAGDADFVMAAIVGCAGLLPVMAAIEAGKTIGMANKESLVSAGALMMDAAARHGATLLPVDSEHNAIFQCLAGNRREDVSRLILTARGGPYRTEKVDHMQEATPAQAIAHPNWSMGAKISVDSATLMNKGLELIEAHHLFAMPADRIDILIHPQSVIHSFVEFIDGSLLAQLGSPDMRIPISYALAWPERMASAADRLDIADIARFDFDRPDEERFPALRIVREALGRGGGAPAVLNAANEAAVAACLAGYIRFTDIAEMVEDAVAETPSGLLTSIDDVIALDRQARSGVESRVEERCS